MTISEIFVYWCNVYFWLDRNHDDYMYKVLNDEGQLPCNFSAKVRAKRELELYLDCLGCLDAPLP